jgi:hypothetical protein
MGEESLAYASPTTLSRQQLTDTQTAEFLNISVSTLRRWRLVGGVGPRWIRIGSSIRYPVRDLEVYLASVPSGGGHPKEPK